MRGFRRRRLAARVGPAARALLAAAVLWGLARLGGRVADPVIRAVGDMQAQAIAMDAVNRVVVGQVVRGVSYADLVRYETDAQGNVTVLQTNTPLVNEIAARAVRALQAELARIGQRTFRLPVGDLFGSPFLAGLGPGVPVRFVPVGAVTADVRNRFEAAGINQTRHVVSLALTARVRVVIPLVTREVTVTSELPLAETVITGKVPESFWLGGTLAPPSTVTPRAGAP
ncbi:sporulation protein YunB [Caldinitratiruptor microaerophilus]|uniref:Sporulation protein YunB n=1 Tax=Caldinitratiruptor microaerophilus TaxID=671077 RepID=A0AA35G886_9FIRM|nr:sporulation protein YunB [Caldinitratiruptor microaerophilus]BDG60816.1 hypothetical protein caldi_19060 [Caldinitratiruptor microaerophilus]